VGESKSAAPDGVSVRRERGEWEVGTKTKTGMTTGPEDATTSTQTPTATDRLDLTALIPEHFERYFAFFRPGHQEGVVPSRIKELARLKIAAHNGCDT
jgi:hypothetical protein